MKKIFFLLLLLFYACVENAPAAIEDIRLPEGFKIEVYFADVPGARSMAVGDKGTLFVGMRKKNGKVTALVDTNADGYPDKRYTVASGLNVPNGVAFRNGSLYVAEINRILRFDGIESSLKKPPPPVIVRDDLPEEFHHGWKFIRFGPDGALYVPIGAPCNVCENPAGKNYAAIMRLDLKENRFEKIAEGIRNTVGFDWDPATGELWFTDNGRDLLGDDIPPDELNHAPHKGMHFGFPYCHGKGIADPLFGRRKNCSDFTPAAIELGPHVASLGMRFYKGSQFPEEYRGAIFIAEHGSWNRTTPLGYRVTVVKLKDNAPVSYEVFAEGWLSDGKVWGRPVDIQVMPDGALLVSDDHAGAIYRIFYSGDKN